jgi:sugar/nucleoside kinase (ribokinase family)
VPAEPSRRARPRILCAGIAVLDQVFQVEAYPQRDSKVEASEFATVGGGCAANAALAIARLGGEVRFAGPLGGPAGDDTVGDAIVARLAREGIDSGGCVRVLGAASPISAIMVDAAGGRTLACYRDARLRAATPEAPDRLVGDVDLVLADNHFPGFVLPICAAARRRGLPLVLDADKPTNSADPLLALATHVVFSKEGLRRTAGTDDLALALARMAERTDAVLAVTDGPEPMLWRAGGETRRVAAFKVAAVDTLAAGDVFHGAFALALAEGREVAAALRFAAAVAGLKCTRFGGSAATPRRAEVERFLAAQPQIGD